MYLFGQWTNNMQMEFQITNPNWLAFNLNRWWKFQGRQLLREIEREREHLHSLEVPPFPFVVIYLWSSCSFGKTVAWFLDESIIGKWTSLSVHICTVTLSTNPHPCPTPTLKSYEAQTHKKNMETLSSRRLIISTCIFILLSHSKLVVKMNRSRWNRNDSNQKNPLTDRRSVCRIGIEFWMESVIFMAGQWSASRSAHVWRWEPWRRSVTNREREISASFCSAVLGPTFSCCMYDIQEIFSIASHLRARLGINLDEICSLFKMKMKTTVSDSHGFCAK